MREQDVRNAVHAGPLRRYARDPQTRVIDEFAVCLGEARIDIAVVNGKLSGYELKSESDTLLRLPKQAELYSRVFDEVTLVLDQRHVDAAVAMVPSEWGLYEVVAGAKRAPVINKIRKPQLTRSQEPYSIAQLLWKSEVLEILGRVEPKAALTSKPRSWLWQHLSGALSMSQLKAEVRATLKRREDWRK